MGRLLIILFAAAVTILLVAGTVRYNVYSSAKSEVERDETWIDKGRTESMKSGS